MSSSVKWLQPLFVNLLYLFCFTLPILFPSWHNKILLVMVIIWFFLQRENRFRTGHHVFMIIFVAAELMYLLGLTYSQDLSYGFAVIETFGPIALIAWIVFSSEKIFDSKVLKYAIISFVAGVITLNLSSLAFISKDLWDPKNLQSNIILANNHIVDIHPAYVSLYLSFSIFFIIENYFPLQTNNRKKLGWVLFALVSMVGYLIWINSRTGILSFVVAFTFYTLYQLRSRARIIAFSSLFLFIIIILTIPFSRERFFSSPQKVLPGEILSMSDDPNVYTLIARKQILECSIDLLRGPQVLYGYGTGDFRDVLRNTFREKNYTSLFEMGLDSHNEYLAQIHRHGIIGLALFLAFLLMPFRYALRYRSPLLAVFIVLFAVTALFENVFSAQKGVTFFGLFGPLLILYARNKYKSEPDTFSPA